MISKRAYLRAEQPIRTGKRLLIALAGGVVALAACSDDGGTNAAADTAAEMAQADWGHVGTVDGTNAFISIVTGGGEAVAYVCDGENDLGAWFRGEVGADGTIDLSNDDGFLLTATPGDKSFTGAVEFGDGSTHDFSLDPADVGAGLFRVVGQEASDDGVEAGWIVNNEGDQRGFFSLRSLRQPTPALPRGSLVVSGVSYPVSVFLAPHKSTASPPGVPIPYPNSPAEPVIWVTTFPPTTNGKG